MQRRSLTKALRRANVVIEKREQEQAFEKNRAEITAWFEKTRERYKRGELSGGMAPDVLAEIRAEVLRE